MSNKGVRARSVDDPFIRLLAEIRELHKRKRHDYGGNDPLGNLKLCEMAGIPAWVGVSIRLSDKFSRLMNFVRQGRLAVNSEPIRDTLMDMAVYSLLAIVLMDEDYELKSEDFDGGCL